MAAKKSGKKTTKSRHPVNAKMFRSLPLYQILAELHPAKRQLVISHLDDATCDTMAACVRSVFDKSYHRFSPVSKATRATLTRTAMAHRPLFKQVLSKGGRRSVRRRALVQFGAGPLSLILSIAIPWLAGLLAKKFK